MKASNNPEKSQRSIASFFFKPKAGTTSQNGQPKQQQRVLGEKQPAQGPPLVAPGKRQRRSPHEPPAQEKAVHLPRSTSSNLPSPAASSLPDQPFKAEVASQASVRASNTPMQPTGTAPTYTMPTQFPGRIEHRHQRFQQKLVVGAGNKAEQGHARGMPAVTKPKYTPLELQIVELKDKHPGVLLIVEVTNLAQYMVDQCSLHFMT